MRDVLSSMRSCAVLGHPVRHSLSPAIHNAAFEALDLPFVYVAHDVAPADLREAIRGARAMNYRGLSITIPHKVAALSMVDDIDPVARAIGCINTVVNEDGRLLGFNSDGLGALGALRAASADPVGKRVIVLGSGGAARAISMTLAIQAPPAELLVLGVLPEEVATLVGDLARVGRSPVRGLALTESSLAEVLPAADLVLHCTPVGMHPKEDESAVPQRLLRPDLVLFDAVYNPRQTRLLREGSEAGCRIVPGMEMFLGQAAVQFHLWTQRSAPVDVMRRVLEERL